MTDEDGNAAGERHKTDEAKNDQAFPGFDLAPRIAFNHRCDNLAQATSRTR
jgi:hypothetical protein